MLFFCKVPKLNYYKKKEKIHSIHRAGFVGPNPAGEALKSELEASLKELGHTDYKNEQKETINLNRLKIG